MRFLARDSKDGYHLYGCWCVVSTWLTAGIQWEHLWTILWTSVVMWMLSGIGGLSVVLYWSLYLVCYGVHDAGNGVLGDVVL